MVDDVASQGSQVRPSIREKVLETITKFPNGVTTGEIIDAVTDELDIAASTIRQALRELEAEKKIISYRETRERATPEHIQISRVRNGTSNYAR